MNTTQKLLVAALVTGLMMTAVPSVIAQTTYAYGSQVVRGDVDYVPTINQTTNGNLEATGLVRFDPGTPTDLADDIFAIDLDNSNTLTQFDLVIVSSGYGGSAVGKIVGVSDTLLLNQGAAVETNATYVDVNENGFYDTGDVVLACGGTGTLTGTSATNTTFCVYLSGANAGKMVRTSDPFLTTWSSNLAAQKVLDGTSFVFYDIDGDAAFRGKAGEFGWLSPTNLTTGALLPQNSIRVYGTAIVFGAQIKLGDSDFRPTVSVNGTPSASPLSTSGITQLGVIRFDPGTPTDPFDDVFALNNTNNVTTSGKLSQYNLVLATSGYGGSAVGKPISISDTLLIGQGAIVAANSIFVDTNENGFYDSGDVVLVCSGTTLVATSTGAYCIYMSGPNAGKLVRTSDSFLTTWNANANAVITLPFMQFVFYDSDNDGVFRGTTGELAWFANSAVNTLLQTGQSNGTVPLYSLRVFGTGYTFGHQVVLGDSEFVPKVSVWFNAANNLVEAAGIVRFDPGTPTDAFDDVFALDLDDNNVLSQFDIVIATGGYGGSAVGKAVGVSDTLLVNQGAAVTTKAFSVDTNENGFYDAGDVLFLCTGTVLAATSTTTFCIYMSGADAGKLVRTTDSFLNTWRTATTQPHTGLAFVFYDTDGDGRFRAKTGELGWLVNSTIGGAGVNGSYVPQFSVRVFGNAGSVLPPTTPPGTTPPTTPPGTTPPTTPPGTTPPGTTPPGTTPPVTPPGTTPPATPNKKTPGFELAALVAALGAALVLVRRKN